MDPFDLIYDMLILIDFVFHNLLILIFTPVFLLFANREDENQHVNPVSSVLLASVDPVSSTIRASLNPVSSVLVVPVNPVSSTVQAPVNRVSSAIRASLNPANSVLQAPVNPVSSTVQALVNPVRSTIRASVNPASSVLVAPVNPVSSTVQAPVNPVSSAIQASLNPANSVLQAPVNPVSSIVQALVNPVRSTIRASVNPVNSVLRAPVNPVSSTVQAPVNPVSSTIRASLNPVSSVLVVPVNPVSSTVQAPVNRVSSAIRASVNPVNSVLRAPVNPVSSTVQAPVNPVSSTVRASLNPVNSVLRAPANPVSSTVQALVNPVRTTIQAFLHPVSSLVQVSVNPISSTRQVPVSAASSTLQTQFVNPRSSTDREPIISVRSIIQATVKPVVVNPVNIDTNMANSSGPQPVLPLIPRCNFKIICRDCFWFLNTTRLSLRGLYDELPHSCPKDQLAVQQHDTGDWVCIRKWRRPFNWCRFNWFKICNKCRGDPCTNYRCFNPHNKEEQMLWNMEYKNTFSITEFIDICRSSMRGYSGREESTSSRPPYQVVEGCYDCWKSGGPVLIGKSLTRTNFCQKNAHEWKPVFLTVPGEKQVGKPPPVNGRWCIHFLNSNRCMYLDLNVCRFAHSQEELELWKWMKSNSICELSELVSRCASHDYSSSLTCNQRDCASEVMHCRFCNERFNSSEEFEKHSESTEHNNVVERDKRRLWNHRQPLWTVIQDGLYQLCNKHINGGCCKYSNVSDSDNLCKDAHSQSELDEWKEHFSYRQKWKKLCGAEMSYINKLSAKYHHDNQKVLCESLSYVEVMLKPCDDLAIFSIQKNHRYTWTFYLTTTCGKQLKKVALLNDSHRSHFALLDIATADESCQVADGKNFLKHAVHDQSYTYIVRVNFYGGIYGYFCQWVTFEFDYTDPVLFRKVSVELGDYTVQKRITIVRRRQHYERWTCENKQIIHSDANTLSPMDKDLLSRYPIVSADEVINQSTLNFDLNENNYAYCMHNLLHLEELARAQIISRFNMKTTMKVSKMVQGSALLNSKPGTLFGQIELGEENHLSEDTDAGKLALRSVNSVLVAPANSTNDVVYEAHIVDESNFSGRQKNCLYIHLSQSLCLALNVQSVSLNVQDVTKACEVRVQFVMDRPLFCQMHYAVDQLYGSSLTKVVFPTLIIMPKRVTYNLDSFISHHLNVEQTKFLEYCGRKQMNWAPPLLVYGPFGTGKTETIVWSSVFLVSQNPDVKILICTHTNQAADLYILRYHSDKKIKEYSPGLKVLRLYNAMRRLATVKDEVKQYCLLDLKVQAFLLPEMKDIESHQIVVTTVVGSLALKKLNVKGKFTHIFIDEAAQVEECQAIMPLCLADNKTCVVLAGDHMQMGYKVYSDEARRKKFNISLFERLFNLFKNSPAKHLIDNPLPSVVLLKKNYRSHHEITSFISGVFYDGQVISSAVANTTLLIPPGWKPLVFCVAEGKEEQDENSTSYFNMVEVYATAEQVDSFYKKWPVDLWGTACPEKILVTTPYSDQVSRLRGALRHRGLGKVTVLGVENIPGLEFHAVFISTVRTRQIPAVTSDTGDSGDFGFLSDLKSLNSALTRAKYFVAVIGDPVALCCIGKCKDLWKRYVRSCTIIPGRFTSASIEKSCKALTVAFPPLTEFAMPIPRPVGLSTLETEIHGTSSLATADNNYDYWTKDYQIEPDEIIKLLAFATDGIVKPGKGVLEQRVSLYQEKGHVYFDIEMDTASGARNNNDEMKEDEMKEEELDEFRRDPQKYVNCVLDLETAHNPHGKPLDKAAAYKKIRISSRKKSDRAFHNDEVVMEVFQDNQEAEPFGKVVGILKRGMNPKHRHFVCHVEKFNTSKMVPINRGIPWISNLEYRIPGRNVKNEVFVYSFCEGRPKFERFESINPLDPWSKLFVVRYLKWDKNFTFPLGIVVDVINSGCHFSNARKILSIEHNVPRKFTKEAQNEEAQNEVNQILAANRYSIYSIPSSLRGIVSVFTIDQPNTRCFDDALSIEEVQSTDNRVHLLIGVHIVDVSFFIEKDSAIDMDAHKRGASFYGGDEDSYISMLPHDLTAIMSFELYEDRRAISVFFTTDLEGKISEVNIERSIVRSYRQLNFEKVEMIITNNEVNMKGIESSKTDNIHNSILKLNTVSEYWAKMRLGTGASFYHHSNRSSMNSPRACSMVREMMTMANREVAKRLIANRKFRDCTPLRCQQEPNFVELLKWRKKFADDARNSVVLHRPYKKFGEACICSPHVCTCFPDVANPDHLMEIKKTVETELANASVEDDFNKIQQLVLCPEHHPQLSLALSSFQNICSRSYYVCSSEILDQFHGHYTINVPVYAHITSPLRRYMDIVAQRLIVALIEDKASPYNKSDILEMCTHCSDALRRAKNWKKDTAQAHLSQILLEKPVVVHPFVETIEESGIVLHNRSVVCIRTAVSTSCLKPSIKPSLIPDSVLRMQWSQRIYDIHERSMDLTNSENPIALYSDWHIVRCVSEKWRDLVEAILVGNQANIKTNIKRLQQTMQSSRETHNMPFMSDVSTQQHFCNYSMTFHPGSVVQVQLTTEMNRGLLRPSVQLFHLTNEIQICVEHNQSPIECFANNSAASVNQCNITDINSYQKCWLSILAMDSAKNAVRNGLSAIVHNVHIEWRLKQTQPVPVWHGFLDIPVKFCKERFIEIMELVDDEDPPKKADLGPQGNRNCMAYTCIRYANLQYLQPQSFSPEDTIITPGQGPTWVGHCVVIRAVKNFVEEEESYSVELQLNMCSASPPPELLMNKWKLLATMEWIHKPLPNRRMEQAVETLNSATKLAQDIALGNIALGRSQPQIEAIDLKCTRLERHLKDTGLPDPNWVQAEALEHAMVRSFSLICGPPGTGKTIVVVRLALLFAHLNKRLRENKHKVAPQVMCCGPSNKSVDVITDHLRKHLPAGIKLVRVYSTKKVERDFPIPRKLTLIKDAVQNNSRVQDLLKQVSLHHMIREVTHNRDSAEKICEIDARIKNDPNSVDDTEVKEYCEAIYRAEAQVLSKANIILLTCSASGASRLKSSTNIVQLIIDECGMCTEPESLIPIVSSGAQKIVLVGDDKQLRPIITDDAVDKRGLGRSLFERYTERAEMLTIQYRMHLKIASFPSEQFYEDRLTIGDQKQTLPSNMVFWPGGPDFPLVFVDIKGKEESLPVATSEGNEQSKSNPDEVNTLVKILRAMVRKHKIRASNIAILSQYRAQCAIITKELQSYPDLKDKVIVQTVVLSQGSEWEYVILSTVRSLPESQIDDDPSYSWKRKYLGCLTDKHQNNVALTRSKKGLIITGNKMLLKCDKMWKELIEFYEKHEAVVTGEEFVKKIRR